MPKRDADLLKERDNAIRRRFKALTAEKPEWRYVAVLNKVAAEFWLEPGTIQKIVLDAKPKPTNQKTIFDNLEDK